MPVWGADGTFTGPGRPRRYCRVSHRQRHYEARREAVLRDLNPGEVLYRSDDIRSLRDAIYVVKTALQDARMDLADAATLEEYPGRSVRWLKPWILSSERHSSPRLRLRGDSRDVP